MVHVWKVRQELDTPATEDAIGSCSGSSSPRRCKEKWLKRKRDEEKKSWLPQFCTYQLGAALEEASPTGNGAPVLECFRVCLGCVYGVLRVF